MLDRDESSRVGASTIDAVASDTFFTEKPSLPSASDLVETSVREILAAVRKLAGAPPSRSEMSPRVRAQLQQARHLLDSLGSDVGRATDAANEPSRTEVREVCVADDGTWFQANEGQVDVARRGAVRRILVGLSRARLDEPGKALSVGGLFEIGWPGERIPYESQVRRVYTAIWTLRTLGLDGVLLTRDEGYLLDPKRAVRLAA